MHPFYAVLFLLFCATFVNATPTLDQSSPMILQHRRSFRYPRRRVRCTGKCFIGPYALYKASTACWHTSEPCTVEQCDRTMISGRTRDGYRCIPMGFGEPDPSMSGTVTPAPSIAPSTDPLPDKPVSSPEVAVDATDEPSVPASPSPSVSAIVVPISEGPVEVPEIIAFPESIEIGGVVDAEVTVVLDEVSSSLKEDIYLLTDATASMTEEIRTIQERFGSLVAARRNASVDVAFGVGFYRDEEDENNFKNVQPITSNTDTVTTAINSLVAEGATDDAEANLFALSQVATQDSIGWRDGSRKILVYMGDAPGHEPTCPKGGSPITRDVVINQLNEKGIAVVATNFAASKRKGLNDVTYSSEGPNFGCPSTTKSGRGQANQITSETLGALEQASNPKTLIDVIRDTIGSLDQELDVKTMDCGDRVQISFSPQLPISIAAGETKTITEKATIMPAACDFPDGFKCEISINLSGVGIRQTIQTTSISGCT